MGAEGRIRSKVIDLDLIEAVIGLGPNLFYGAGIAACIVVCRQKKSENRQGKILLIDGSELFQRGRNQNSLEPEHVNALYEAYKGFSDVDGLSKVVTIDEVHEQDSNLNIAAYVSKIDEKIIPRVEEATKALEEALNKAWQAEDRLNKLLVEMGIS
jgi:type I restriction enzyme M protein